MVKKIMQVFPNKTKEKLYKLEQFDDFLLSSDSSVRDLGWKMVSNSFNCKKMSLDELMVLKVQLDYKKYVEPSPFHIQSFSSMSKSRFNATRNILEKRVDKFISRYSTLQQVHSKLKVEAILKLEDNGSKFSS